MHHQLKEDRHHYYITERWKNGQRKEREVYFRPDRFNSSSTASLHKYLISQSNMSATQCIWTSTHGQGGLLKLKAHLMFFGVFFGTSFRYLIFVQVICDEKPILCVRVCMKTLKSEFFHWWQGGGWDAARYGCVHLCDYDSLCASVCVYILFLHHRTNVCSLPGLRWKKCSSLP